ncbi:MAG: hypothetical protein IIC88_00635 [Chloroflexi bacterium]|nr:hypothetical protein [Chloroflexota bacterium]
MRIIGLLLAGMLFIALIAACTSDDGANGDGSTDATPTTESDDAMPTSESTDEATATPEVFSLPDTPISASLTTTYGPSEALPVAAGSVEARWYQSGGMYVVHYAGLSLDETGPICPGNSISTDSGFLHISNQATGPGACTGATTVVLVPAGVQLCGAEVLYLTIIPVDVEGTLYGSLERYLADGTIAGLTSTVTADAAAAPEVDLSSCLSPQG